MTTSLELFNNKNVTSLDVFPADKIKASEGYTAALSGQIAHIKSAMDSSIPYQEHFNNAKVSLENADREEDVLNAVVDDYRIFQTENLLAAADEEITAGVPAEEVIEAVQSIEEESSTIFGSTYGLEAAQMLAAGGTRLEQAMIEQTFYQRQIAKLAEDIGFFETAKDFGMLMIPSIGVDLSEITGGDVLSSYEDFKELVRNFWSKDKEVRAEMFPHVIEDIVKSAETLGIENKTKAIMFASLLFDPEIDSQLALEKAIERTDWALLGLPLAGAAVRSIKGYNAVRHSYKMGDKNLAAELNNAALGDSAVAESMNVDKTVAGANAMPFNYEKVMPETADGMASDVLKSTEEIKRRRAATQYTLNEAMRQDNLLKEAAVTEAEKKAAQNLDDLRENIFKETSYYAEEAEIVNRTDTGFSIKYKLNGEDREHIVRYTHDDVKGFTFEEQGQLSAGQIETKVWSPQVWMDRILNDSVEVATRLNFAQQKLLTQLQTASRAAIKGLSRKQKRDLDDVLIAGDAWDNGIGKVFTQEELLEGISVGDRMVKLSPKQIGSYYAQRDIFDAMHFFKNGQVRADLEFHGWKGVKVDSAVASMSDNYAKPYNTAQSIPNELYGKSFKILDTRGKGSAVLSHKLDMPELYEKGFRVVKVRSPILHGDGDFQYALVKADEITELPHIVLNKKAGYVPKISEDGWYWVKKSEPVTRNGMAGHHKISTIRAFDNMKDAQKFADDANLSAPDGVKYEPKPDRDLSVSEKNNEIIAEAGGLWTGHRSSREIKFGLEGSALKRISAYDAMQRNIQHIANNVPINEWRMGMIQRWLNSAKPYMEHPDREMAKGLDASISKARPGSKEEVALRSSREWIQDQLRIPTDSERRWSAMTSRMGEWMEGKAFLDPKNNSLSLRRGMMHMSSKDPYSAMRGAAFHTLLGWFNPAQLFVQAQGASIAFALDPVNAPKRTAQYMALRAAWGAKHSDTAIKATAKAAGVDAKEMKEIVEQLDKTGLMDSYKATADYNAAAQLSSMGVVGTSAGVIKRVADKGLIFYQEGERFTRGYAFLIARANWIKRNPGKKIDDDALREILTRTTTKMLNLTRANRAHWQRGFWSLPTQFQQVTFKFIENMMPNIMPGATKKFTAAEKRRIMAGQLFLYGGAGIPFGTWIASEAARMGGQDPATLSDEWKAMATDGFWGVTQELMFGEHVSTGKRGALASGIEQFYEDLFLHEVPISEAALGAFGTVPKRSIQALSDMAPLVTNPTTFNYTAKEFINAGLGFTDIFSGFNGFHKAWKYYKYQEMRDSNGILIAELDDDEVMFTALGRAAGFSPSKYDAYFKGTQWLAAKARMEKEARDAYRKAYMQYLTPGASFDEAHKQNFKMKQVAIFLGMNEAEIGRIKAAVHKEEWEGESKASKQRMKILRARWESDDITKEKETIMFNKDLGTE